MPKATGKGATLAESEVFEEVEGNVYFPPSALKEVYFEPSDHQTVCGWKGTASYYHVVVDGERNENAAWYYPDPKLAFWHGVVVE